MEEDLLPLLRPHDRVLEVITAITAAGLAKQEVLDALTTGIHAGYVGMLPAAAMPMARVMQVIDRLNTTGRLDDGSVPLRVWLKNAILYAAGQTAPLKVLNQALADVDARISGARPAPDFRKALPDHNERIIHDNDLLPVSFLQRGAAVVGSVARLLVPRFDGGQPTSRDGVRVRYLGTGWLAAPDLLVTNHHVVNGRDGGEADAGDADLRLQATGMEVLFDFDDAAAAPSQVEHIGTLEAFAPHSGPLDYAVLRLTRKLDRRPLVVAREPFSGGADGGPAAPPGRRYRAVNIIQHPEGAAKMVACRNNLVTRADATQIWYFTDTMAGSSGSPVFDDQWRVVALHKKWDYIADVSFQGRDTAWANAGTQLAAILADLRSRGKAALVDEMRLA